MVQQFNGYKQPLLACLAIFFLANLGLAQDDPPNRVARLNYTNGDVSMLPAGYSEWVPSELNRPLTTGDGIYAGDRSVAEFHLDNAVIRLGQNTNSSFLNLNDQVAQLRLSEGDVSVGVYGLNPGEVLEIDTPNAAITLLRAGSYRVHVDPNTQTAYLAVHNGQAEVSGDQQAFTVDGGNGVRLFGVDQLAYDVEAAPSFDVFDSWCSDRDRQEQHWQADPHALPQDVIGGEDLADNGAWTETPDYGPVWCPRNVPTDWAPYQDGHWAHVQPWGWTWISSAAWGFAPFHYGRWVWWRNRWGWTPGPLAVRGGPPLHSIYAPALVAWIGGSAVHGGGPHVGWVPLGPGEVYTPGYRCSPAYFEHVNVRNTRILRTVNITSVYQTVYVHQAPFHQRFVNAAAPRGVAMIPLTTLASGHPVRAALVGIQPNSSERFRSGTILRPAVKPIPIIPFHAVGGRLPVHPDRRLEVVPVVARTQPSGVGMPAALAASHRSDTIQFRSGMPQNHSVEHKGVDGVGPVVAAPPVHLINPGQPIAVHAGMHAGVADDRPRQGFKPAGNGRSADNSVSGDRRQESIGISAPNRIQVPPGAPPINAHRQPPYSSLPNATPAGSSRTPAIAPSRPVREDLPQRSAPPQYAPARVPAQQNVRSETPPPHVEQPRPPRDGNEARHRASEYVRNQANAQHPSSSANRQQEEP